MKKLFLLPLILIFVVSCGSSQLDQKIKQNADAAENFIYLVLNEPDEAKKLMHEDFIFRYMGKIPVYAQGSSVIKKSYNGETYFTEFCIEYFSHPTKGEHFSHFTELFLKGKHHEKRCQGGKMVPLTSHRSCLWRRSARPSTPRTAPASTRSRAKNSTASTP